MIRDFVYKDKEQKYVGCLHALKVTVLPFEFVVDHVRIKIKYELP